MRTRGTSQVSDLEADSWQRGNHGPSSNPCLVTLNSLDRAHTHQSSSAFVGLKTCSLRWTRPWWKVMLKSMPLVLKFMQHWI
ncbi:hypothetical protein Nepgr_019287 [Nepenthes gracilis]|uniref:Uncharacterized protein n=1 Tax=Nepenthes gracilis TaxID=150966 RepID=A0AAD3XV60_NEPGR|nr:hypothetical protein Nepgr_019287 [Nepenthes gracilis]